MDTPDSQFECQECKGIGVVPRWWNRLGRCYFRKDVGSAMGLAFLALVFAFLFTGFEPLLWAAVVLILISVIVGVWFTLRG